MKMFRLILLISLLIAVAIFWYANPNRVELRIWGDLVVEANLATFLIAAFLLGLVPMCLIHRTTRWRLQRRITNLETTLAGSASLSSTQLEARKANEAP